MTERVKTIFGWHESDNAGAKGNLAIDAGLSAHAPPRGMTGVGTFLGKA